MANVSRPATIYTASVKPAPVEKKKSEAKKSTKKIKPKNKPSKKTAQPKNTNRKKLLPWM